MKSRSTLWVLILSFLIIPTTTIKVHADVFAGEKAYGRGDYEIAFKEFFPEAEQGNVSAQRYIATMYQYGLGVEPNQEEAFYWRSKADELNSEELMNSVDQIRSKGAGKYLTNNPTQDTLAGIAEIVGWAIAILLIAFICLVLPLLFIKRAIGILSGRTPKNP